MLTQAATVSPPAIKAFCPLPAAAGREAAKGASEHADQEVPSYPCTRAEETGAILPPNCKASF